MTPGQKRQYVRQELNMVAVEADKLLDGKSIADSSMGLVGASGGSGGHSGKLSDFTAIKALAGAMDSTIDKKALNWYGLASDLYVMLRTEAGKTPYEAKRDREIALVFYERVLRGKRIAKIADDEQLEMKRVSKLYAIAIDRCVRLADSRGMIP